MATVRQAKHEMLKAKWQQIIAEQRQSGETIRTWCDQNEISAPSFFYWSKVIREDALINSGVLAVTEKSCFTEVTPADRMPARASETSSVCAVIRVHNSEIEIHNNADAKTLAIIMSLVGKSL